MTETERKALALVNEVREEEGLPPLNETYFDTIDRVALCRAIEHHEAYKQEVSDACSTALETMVKAGASACERSVVAHDTIARFILPKPVDPLVECLNEVMPDVDGEGYGVEDADDLREAIEKRGGKIIFN